VPDFGIKKKAYRPLWQDTPGYKTVVDDKSTKGILPSQLESTNPDRGQGNMDATWPVAPGVAREKERALPLPSNHDKKREKRVGPTVYNKPRKVPDRTLSIPGEEYGHPTKFDYGMPRRRNFPRPPAGTLAGADDDLELGPVDDIYEEDPTDDQMEVEGGTTNKGPFPSERQKNLSGQGRMAPKRWYRRNKEPKKRKEKREWKIERRKPKQKLKRRYRRDFPHRYKRKGIDARTPAQKTKAWREEQKKGDVPGTSDREAAEHMAGLELLGEVMEMLGFEFDAANWPVDWNTHVKKTQPPGELDQNFGPGQSRDTGTPRKDPDKQKGQSLRVPGLFEKHQKGLFTQQSPPAAGQINTPTTNNPTDGSGKVLPMSYYTDLVNNTQAVPDGRQDRYERNNNFEVKQGRVRVAFTLGEILKRIDGKIKERAKDRVPKLARIDTKNWIWHWRSGEHTVKVQAFKRGRAENFTKLNLRVSCSCPFWRWWGPEHWGTKSDYQRGPLQGTAAYPKIRDPARWRPVCKHAYAVLEKSQKFFVRPEKSPLRKLAARFSVDSPDQIEVEILNERIAARVAQRHLERQISRSVLRRYVGGEES
jgi:hypothetical protein